MEEQENEKIIFGLTPKATFINSIVLFVLSAVFWAIYFYKHIPVDIKKLEWAQISKIKFDIDVPWYCDLPLELLGMVMLFRWVDYKFKFNPIKFELKSLFYKFMCLIPIIFFTALTKMSVLIIILKNF